MSADKRSVATDALETLGKLITENEKRDAIHLAVEPVVAGEDLRPGEDVGFSAPGLCAGEGACDKLIGIVDPFLKKKVRKGQRFWLIVYPRQITSLRHVWTHPAFDDSDGGPCSISSRHSASREWLEEFAANIGSNYAELMSHASAYVQHGDYWSEGGRFESERVPDEFWTHYAAVTGVVSSGSFFSCSC